MTWAVSVRGEVRPAPLFLSRNGEQVELPAFSIPYYGMEDSHAATLEDAIAESARIVEIEPGENLDGVISLVDGRVEKIVLSNGPRSATLKRVVD